MPRTRLVFLLFFVLLRRFFVLQDRLARTTIWSERTPTWDAGSGTQWRVLGLVLALISLFMLIGPFIRARRNHPIHELSTNNLLLTQLAVGSHLGSLLFPLLFLALGVSFVIKPNFTVRWVA